MTGDDALDKRGAGARLADHEDRRRVSMPLRIVIEPGLGKGIGEGRVHFLLRGFVEIDGLATRAGTALKGLECPIPVLEILEFLAQRITEKSERTRIL